MPEERVQDLENIIKEDDNAGEADDLEVEEPEEGSEEQGEEALEGEEGLEGEEEGEEGKGKPAKLESIPQYKEVVKKYPDFFKDFPNFRHVVFQAKEYREMFPTVEEAREALQDLEGLQELQQSLESGKPEDTVKVLSSLKGLGDDVIPNLATNFLNSIKKIDQDLYYQVITPEIVNFTRTMFNAGLRAENDNLKNAALHAAIHFFGDPKVASGEKDVKLPTAKEPKKDDQLEKDRQAFRNERYTTFYNDVVQLSDSSLLSSIQNGIDPKEQMTDGMKDLVSERVMKEITRVLASDSSHRAKMDSLWKRAAKDNFSPAWKAKIRAAYIESAKEIMPKIRAKVRNSVLGIRERPSENSGGERRTKRIEPSSNAGGGRQSSSNKVPASKDVDWRKTSDLDFIRGNVTLKNAR
jgi:hypothetical protein